MPRPTTTVTPLLADLIDGGAAREKAVAKLRSIIAKADGKIDGPGGIAERIGVSHNTATKIMKLSGLRTFAGELRAKAGVHGPRNTA